jgi:hypothetical protein
MNVNLLDEATLFLHVATREDIEHERQALEAKHGQVLAAYDVEVTTRSVLCTRVTWEIK